MTIEVVSTNKSDSDSHSTGNTGQPASGSRSRSTAVTYSEIARRLIKPEEVLTLDQNICAIFHKNLPVVFGRLVKYFEAPEFRRGGTGAPRRLGLAAAVMAGFTFAASTVIAALALAVTSTSYGPGLPGRMQTMGQPSLPATYGSQPNAYAR
jgi:type IV secretion system protein VirD4